MPKSRYKLLQPEWQQSGNGDFTVIRLCGGPAPTTSRSEEDEGGTTSLAGMPTGEKDLKPAAGRLRLEAAAGRPRLEAATVMGRTQVNTWNLLARAHHVVVET